MNAGVYSLIAMLFLVLVFVDHKLSEQERKNYFGWALIVLVTAVVCLTHFISLREAITGLKRRIAACKKAREARLAKKMNKVHAAKAKEDIESEGGKKQKGPKRIKKNEKIEGKRDISELSAKPVSIKINSLKNKNPTMED